MCQVCGKTRHTTAHCYFRYDHNYIGSFPNATNPNFSSVNNSVSHPTSNTVSDSNWYMYSGASSHITNDSTNIQHVTNPYGKEKIEVGNGEKLYVYKSGLSTLPCKNQNLTLTEVLHVPQVTKKSPQCV